MAVQPGPDPRHDPALHRAAPADDELLVVRFVAGDAEAAEEERASRLVAECPACAELAADLRAITASMRTLPVPRRARDFQLSQKDADRLRRSASGGRLAALRGWLAGPAFAFSRPLATGLVTLGVAGFLLTSLPSPGATSILSTVGHAVGVPGEQRAASSAGADTFGSPAVPAAASPIPLGPQSSPAATAGPSASSNGAGGPSGSGSGSGSAGKDFRDDGQPSAPPGGGGPSLPPVQLLSLVAIALGGAVLLLRWAAARGA